MLGSCTFFRAPPSLMAAAAAVKRMTQYMARGPVQLRTLGMRVMALQWSTPAMDLFLQRLRGSESKEEEVVVHVECKLAKLRDSAHSKAEFWSTVTVSDMRLIPQAQRAVNRGLLAGMAWGLVLPISAIKLGAFDMPFCTGLSIASAMFGVGWYIGLYAATSNEVMKMRHMWCAAGQDCDRALKELQEQRHDRYRFSKEPAEVAEAVKMLLLFDHVDFSCTILPTKEDAI